MLYEYVATYGDKYIIDSFKGYRELRKDHLELLFISVRLLLFMVSDDKLTGLVV